MDKRYQIFGATPSPYTQKMISLMRFKRIPFDVHFGDVASLLKERNISPPKPVLLPVMLLEDDSGNEIATTDSTPIIRTLEKKHPERSVLPQDQALNLLTIYSKILEMNGLLNICFIIVGTLNQMQIRQEQFYP